MITRLYQIINIIILVIFVNSATTYENGLLTAGDIDDNLNYQAFLNYRTDALAKASFYPNPDLSQRISVNVVDELGSLFSCAIIELQGDDEIPAGTNGQVVLYPALDGMGSTPPWTIAARTPGGNVMSSAKTVFSTEEPVVLMLPALSSLPRRLDVVLALDTTGSMCDELEYLQAEFEYTLENVIERVKGTVDVRVGMVAFRDHGDAYLLRTTPLGPLSTFITALTEEYCAGGSDFPEAMDEALEEAASFQWREGNVARVLFLISDAPPREENLQRALDAALSLRKKGVRVYGLAASGVADSAEYMLRLISLMTGARYTWLTDDSGIGRVHAIPKVLCYKVTSLGLLLERILESELVGRRVEPDVMDVIRESGQQIAGVCVVDMTPAPVGMPTAAPVADGPGFPTAPVTVPVAVPVAAPVATDDFADDFVDNGGITDDLVDDATNAFSGLTDDDATATIGDSGLTDDDATATTGDFGLTDDDATATIGDSGLTDDDATATTGDFGTGDTTTTDDATATTGDFGAGDTTTTDDASLSLNDLLGYTDDETTTGTVSDGSDMLTTGGDPFTGSYLDELTDDAVDVDDLGADDLMDDLAAAAAFENLVVFPIPEKLARMKEEHWMRSRTSCAPKWRSTANVGMFALTIICIFLIR